MSSKSGMSDANARQGMVNKPRYEAYRNERRKEQNKARRIARHLRQHPWDKGAINALLEMSQLSRKWAGVAIPELALSPAEQRKQKGVTLTQIKKIRRRPT